MVEVEKYMFFDKFLCQNFQKCEFDSVFMVLGAQSIVIVLSHGQGMVISFKMSHSEAL